jgi:hypothetical protein
MRKILRVMKPIPAYYLSISGQEYGPYSVADLEAALAEDTISSDCSVRAGIGGDWKPVTEIVGSSLMKKRGGARRKTAYPWLRGLINVLAIAAVLVLGGLCVYASYQAIRDRELALALAAAQFLATLLGVLVSWGLSLVLIDIADNVRPAGD